MVFNLEVIERTDTIRERKITPKSAEIPAPDGAVTSAPIQEIAAPERKQSENNNQVSKQPVNNCILLKTVQISIFSPLTKLHNQ